MNAKGFFALFMFLAGCGLVVTLTTGFTGRSIVSAQEKDKGQAPSPSAAQLKLLQALDVVRSNCFDAAITIKFSESGDRSVNDPKLYYAHQRERLNSIFELVQVLEESNRNRQGSEAVRSEIASVLKQVKENLDTAQNSLKDIDKLPPENRGNKASEIGDALLKSQVAWQPIDRMLGRNNRPPVIIEERNPGQPESARQKIS